MSESTYSIIAFPGAHLPPEYQALVYSKWLRSLRYGSPFFKLMESGPYFDAYHDFIWKILHQPDCKVTFAVLTEDKDVVLGFATHRGAVLDYVHVHKDMRNQGIGSNLVPESIKTITHLTKVGEIVWKRKYNNWVFNPFA